MWLAPSATADTFVALATHFDAYMAALAEVPDRGAGWGRRHRPSVAWHALTLPISRRSRSSLNIL